MDDAVRYLCIIFIGSLFVNFAQSSNMVMRGEEVMKTSMMIMGFGAKNFNESICFSCNHSFINILYSSNACN